MGEGQLATCRGGLPLFFFISSFHQNHMKWSVFFSFVVAVLAVNPAMAQVSLAANGNVKASESYQISPLDVLHFRIVGELETETEVRVAQDGSITLPYLGTVNITGKTVAQAREFLFAEYSKDFYVNPQIDLVIVSYKERRVNVQGMVNRQGFVLFPPEEKMTLMGAIALAGGWGDNRLAQKSAVKLIRTDEDGVSKTYVIDTQEISQEDWPLQDGDLIVVPERKW